MSFGLVRIAGVAEAQSDTMKKDEMKKDDVMMEQKQQ